MTTGKDVAAVQSALDEIVAEWVRVESGANGIKGDLAAEVETCYGENRLGEFADRVGTPLDTIRDLRRVARAYPENWRRSQVSWGVHRVFACEPDRDKLIRDFPEGGTVTLAKALLRKRTGSPLSLTSAAAVAAGDGAGSRPVPG